MNIENETLSYFISLGLVFLHFSLIIAVSIRVIMKRYPVGASLSWLLLFNFLPYVGVILYFLFGERYLGIKHTNRLLKLQSTSEQLRMDGKQLQLQDWNGFHPMCFPLSNYELNCNGVPAMGGNRIKFIEDANLTIQAIITDIDRAVDFCHMEFYIWFPGGLANAVIDALIRAQQRGVICRVILDAVGSQTFFRSHWPKCLTKHGISVVKACPIGIIPWKLARYDLRNHRKIVVIDGKIAYAGSFNLIDPMYFKQDQNVGQWIDVMARIEGPVVPVIDGVFRWDWNIETGKHLELFPSTLENRNEDVVLQVAPSGPDHEKESILNSLLQAIYSAQSTIQIVTPYFVPGDSLAQSLITAARRGVCVELILPAKVDSFLVRHASHSYYQDLLQAGVHIHHYDKGLLHTKCVILDSAVSFFGTVNLDLRSLWLNFEMTLIIYSESTSRDLMRLFHQYKQDSTVINIIHWNQRPVRYRFFENVMHLFSPLI